MTKEDFEILLPFMDTLSEEQIKVIYYIEARKKGNPCITNEEKQAALKMPLIDTKKIKLHNWNHGKENNYY